MKTNVKIVNHAAIIDVGYKHHFDAEELDKCIKNTVEWLKVLMRAKEMLEKKQ